MTDTVAAIHDIIAELLPQGKGKKAIIEECVRRGYEAGTAKTQVPAVFHHYDAMKRKHGRFAIVTIGVEKVEVH